MINIRGCSCAAEEFLSRGGGLQSVETRLVKSSTKGFIVQRLAGAQFLALIELVIPGLTVILGSALLCCSDTTRLQLSPLTGSEDSNSPSPSVCVT